MGQNVPPLGSDGAAAIGSVIAHPGEHDAEDMRPEGLSGGFKKTVGGRAAELIRRFLIENGNGSCRRFSDSQVVSPGSQQSGSWSQGLSVRGFLDLER